MNGNLFEGGVERDFDVSYPVHSIAIQSLLREMEVRCPAVRFDTGLYIAQKKPLTVRDPFNWL